MKKINNNVSFTSHIISVASVNQIPDILARGSSEHYLNANKPA